MDGRIVLRHGETVSPGTVPRRPHHPQHLELDDALGLQRAGRVGALYICQPPPQRKPTHRATPVLRDGEDVRHPQLHVAALAQPPARGLDAAAPVGSFGGDDPQPDELRQRERIALLTEPQYPGRYPTHPHDIPLPTLVPTVALALVPTLALALAPVFVLELALRTVLFGPGTAVADPGMNVSE